MTCRRAAELITGALDADLSFAERAGLGLHTLLCGKCRRFRRQVAAIDEAAADYLAGDAGPAAALPPPAKDRLRAVVAGHLGGDDPV